MFILLLCTTQGTIHFLKKFTYLLVKFANLISMFSSAFRIDPLVGGCVNNACGCLVEDYSLVGQHCSLGKWNISTRLDIQNGKCPQINDAILLNKY